MNTIDLITQGRVEGLDEIPEKLITTVSHIFIFKKARKVFKIYRRDNEYWNSNFSDLSSGKDRILFIKEDFKANSLVNPLVYIDLKTAVIANDKVHLDEVDNENDELIIVMNRIETNESFIDTLFNNGIAEKEFISIGEQFAKIKQSINIAEVKTKENWYEIILKRLHDLQLWMENLNFPKRDIEICLQKLQTYVNNQKERLSRISNDKITYSIDGHGENALYHAGKLEFIDILWPSPRWRWTTKEYDIFRLGADISALTGMGNFNAFINGVKNIYTDFDETDKEFYLLYNSALDSCVLKTLTESKPQKIKQFEKYYAWFLNKLNSLNSE